MKTMKYFFLIISILVLRAGSISAQVTGSLSTQINYVIKPIPVFITFDSMGKSRWYYKKVILVNVDKANDSLLILSVKSPGINLNKINCVYLGNEYFQKVNMRRYKKGSGFIRSLDSLKVREFVLQDTAAFKKIQDLIGE
ncbi:hypothetical protein [Chitinophaga sp. Cy-1792]|uniref:hypothetical protein n=1 Tax=Chitinophaga sp. Cy-1792 TaxID=2608339 RepID=UPI001422A176|nr:hypothetical protein [Chitinophaga sp. Cy-1792]NIG52807.1 hypothetical protein [Chitinophaga sp. Cy-1792]